MSSLFRLFRLCGLLVHQIHLLETPREGLITLLEHLRLARRESIGQIFFCAKSETIETALGKLRARMPQQQEM